MNTPDPLFKIAKIIRSVQRTKALNEEVKAFFKSDDHGVIPDFKTEPRYLLIKAFSRSLPPTEWSLDIGEILYQFRSTLDHLACKLTEDNGQIVNSGVEFPICGKPEDFRKSDGTLVWKVNRQIGSMSFAHQALIESEQPFKGKYGLPEDDPLLILHDLARYDRHRNLHLVSTTIREGREEFDPAWFADRYFTQVSANYGQAFEGETEVARYSIDPSAYEAVPNVEVQVKANVTFTIAFDKEWPGAGRPVISTLGAIGDRVARLVGRFYGDASVDIAL